jgi:predicted methyltransferase
MARLYTIREYAQSEATKPTEKAYALAGDAELTRRRRNSSSACRNSLDRYRSSSRTIHGVSPMRLDHAVHALLLPLMLLGQLAAHAESPAVGPDMNVYYHGADHERWRDIFESDGREVYDRRFEIMEALEIRPGMQIADVGAGSGLYTMLFAKAVGPTGRVFAVDISESFIAAIAARAAEAGLGNVLPVLSEQKSTELAPASVDLVFTSDTYHHFEYPRTMLDSIHTALVPGGILAIVDFRREPGFSSRWILGHVRAGREEVIAEVEQAGFKLIDEPIKLRVNYFLRFRKLDS